MRQSAALLALSLMLSSIPFGLHGQQVAAPPAPAQSENVPDQIARAGGKPIKDVAEAKQVAALLRDLREWIQELAKQRMGLAKLLPEIRALEFKNATSNLTVVFYDNALLFSYDEPNKTFDVDSSPPREIYLVGQNAVVLKTSDTGEGTILIQSQSDGFTFKLLPVTAKKAANLLELFPPAWDNRAIGKPRPINQSA